MVRTYPGKSLWIVLLLLVNLAAAELCGAVQVEHKSPRELVQRVFPEAKAWKETRLSADVVMFRGLLEQTSFGVKAHMYATVRMRAGKPQLSMTYAVAAESDQYARFDLRGEEVRAYHANGTLLARFRMWDAPPAQYATAPDLVSLRLVDVEPGFLVAEAENLTAFPVKLRAGKVYVMVHEGDKVVRNKLCIHSEECFLPAGQTRRMKLRICSKRTLFPIGLLKSDRVTLVYRAKEDKLSGKEISPKWILPSGAPLLGELGYEHPILLRDDLAVKLDPSPSGFIQFCLSMYQLREGIWIHTGKLDIKGNHAPFAYECSGEVVRVLDYKGCLLGTMVGIPPLCNEGEDTCAPKLLR